MDLDEWMKVTAPGHLPTEPVDHPRSAKLGKVYVTDETKAILTVLGERFGIGASGVAALVIEELRHQGQLTDVWDGHRRRRRETKYRGK